MAQKIETLLIDDLDGSTAVESVMFGLGGTLYEIDLSRPNAERLRSVLAEFIPAARKSGKRMQIDNRRNHRGRPTDSYDPARKGATQRNQEIREWARKRGMRVSERGRIAADVVEAFESDRRKPEVPVVVKPVSDADILVWWIAGNTNSQAKTVTHTMRKRYRAAHPGVVLEYDKAKAGKLGDVAPPEFVAAFRAATSGG